MKHTIVKQIELAAPVSKVWRALTDHEQFGQWFRVKIEAPFVAGQLSKGRITYPGYECIEWNSIIQKMEPESYFAYSWHPYAVDPEHDYSQEPQTLVEFRLSPIATGTLLEVTESGFEHVPEDRRDEAFRMNSGGWEEQLENIERFVTA